MTEKELLEWFPEIKNLGELFRLAHLHCFNKHLSAYSTSIEVKRFQHTGCFPPYVRKYIDEVLL